MKTIKALKKKKVFPPPIWIMRQAGRYLPEFQISKKKYKGFVNMVYTPKAAAEVTLQPIKRFGFDSAIIFSDILVIPDSMGQKLEYFEGKGPKLQSMNLDEMLDNLKVEKDREKLKKVYESIKLTKGKIKRKTTLIGFVGAPLTLIFFMLDNKREKKYGKILSFMNRNKAKVKIILKRIEEAIAQHATKQIRAGADIIQIFDTWACEANKKELREYSINPIKNICKKIKDKKPGTPIIVFPRNVGKNYKDYLFKEMDCIGVGQDVPVEDIKKLQKKKTIQGNLNPIILKRGGKKLESEVRKILENYSGRPFIFNLSHGILPETPVENVEKLIKLVREKFNYNKYKK